MNKNLAQKVAEKLLEIEAVFLKPDDLFTWTSGIKSPIYCDNRMTLSYVEVRDLIIDGFCETIKANYPNVEIIAGVATAGIPHAAIIAERLKLPLIYVRSSSKGHGRENQIEGKLKANQKVVVIEDLISTGGSSLKAVEALQSVGADILGLAAIFTYGFDKADKAFKDAGVDYYTLSNYEELLQVAVEKNYIKDSELTKLQEWRKDPSSLA